MGDEAATCPYCGWELHAGGVYDTQFHLASHIQQEHVENWTCSKCMHGNEHHSGPHMEDYSADPLPPRAFEPGIYTDEGLCLDN